MSCTVDTPCITSPSTKVPSIEAGFTLNSTTVSEASDISTAPEITAVALEVCQVIRTPINSDDTELAAGEHLSIVRFDQLPSDTLIIN